MKVCEGKGISDCEGDVKRYYVFSKNGINWGIFEYCDAHAQRDRDMGFEVEESHE